MPPDPGTRDDSATLSVVAIALLLAWSADGGNKLEEEDVFLPSGCFNGGSFGFSFDPDSITKLDLLDNPFIALSLVLVLLSAPIGCSLFLDES